MLKIDSTGSSQPRFRTPNKHELINGIANRNPQLKHSNMSKMILFLPQPALPSAQSSQAPVLCSSFSYFYYFLHKILIMANLRNKNINKNRNHADPLLLKKVSYKLSENKYYKFKTNTCITIYPNI